MTMSTYKVEIFLNTNKYKTQLHKTFLILKYIVLPTTSFSPAFYSLHLLQSKHVSLLLIWESGRHEAPWDEPL